MYCFMITAVLTPLLHFFSRRSVQKMIKRGAQSRPHQLEEQLAFKAETRTYREELRRAIDGDVS